MAKVRKSVSLISMGQLLTTTPSIVGDSSSMPEPAATAQEDEDLFGEEPWVEAPFRADYGTNVILGANVFININCFSE